MIIIGISDDKFIYSYNSTASISPVDLICVYDYDTNLKLLAKRKILNEGEFIFSKYIGFYVWSKQLKKNIRNKNLIINCFGNGNFPYLCLSRKYEASYNLNFLSKYTKLEDFPTRNIANYINYTFGIEFETSSGYIPEEKCFENGLIPLRDGSISGIEYSTIVLSGNSGFNLLEKQIKLLNEYTTFNKECALHIHFGGFPLDTEKILYLNNLFYNMFNTIDLIQILPTATFHTDLYKKNNKSYCELNNYFDNFDDLYQNFVGMPYMGSLTQPHPNDIERVAKWNIHSRYVACNLVNMLCYKGPKTVEFRFLRPTKNKDIILFWIYTLNALLLCAEKLEYQINGLEDMYNRCYPKDITKYLMNAVSDLIIIRENQYRNGDICNSMYEFENDFKLKKL